VTVADAPLSATGVDVTSPKAFSGVVANFTDANPDAPAADFTATIDWGDGGSSSGTIGTTAGGLRVSGQHAYATTGFFAVTIHIVDEGGSTATAHGTILIFGTPAGGNFVVGDRSSAVGTPVTFWGAQWWKINMLSGGSAPASFKGFANSPNTLAECGANWATDPGNSSGPPAGPLPAYMAVIVSSGVTQVGPAISGDTARVVVVKTDSGYAPNPGHAGTGTVVGTVC
jgi:hypothetical protein